MASLIGAVSGYVGGRFDAVLMRILDIAMAFPFLVLIIVILAILGPGVQNIYIAVFLVGWTMYARLARAEMLVERNKDYILAARVLGFRPRRIMLPPRAAQHHQLVDRLLDVGFRAQHPAGLRPELPRPRHPAADAGMGRDDRRGQGLHAPGLVDHDHARRSPSCSPGTALSLIGDGLAHRLGERQPAFA